MPPARPALRSAFALAALALSSCAVVHQPYDSLAYRPSHPDDVVVKVSLERMMTYVLEGDRVLLVTPVTIGTAEDPTPTGTFKVFQKIEHKRSNTYGFHVDDEAIRPGMRKTTPPGQRYVGYPMPYWVEFHPGYGFHSGGVWPEPRSHGCLRIHKNVAPKFFELTRVGTPVIIADHLPEDATLGARVRRPTDYADPDPPASLLITDAAFSPSPSELFCNEPAPLIQ